MSRRFGKPAYHFEETDTTMREAAELARNGCPEGAIVTAARQTAGRGRLGRRWLSEPDGGLYLSLVLRPDVAPGAAPLLTLVAGLGAAEAVRAATGLDCDIRWPNDIMIRGRKCAGILVEMETREERVTHAVVGIGLNLNYREFGADLADSATSLLLETGAAPRGRRRLATAAGCAPRFLRNLSATRQGARTGGVRQGFELRFRPAGGRDRGRRPRGGPPRRHRRTRR